MWLLIIAAIITGYYIIHDFIGSVVERFSGLESDQGSGRTMIYSQVLSGLSQSDFFHLIFGHGYKSVKTITMGNVMAHNDILELLYDFGLIGAVIYFLFILSLFKNAIRHRKEKLKKNNICCIPQFVDVFYYYIFVKLRHLFFNDYFPIYACFWYFFGGIAIRRDFS